jgi:hypothetical protein
MSRSLHLTTLSYSSRYVERSEDNHSRRYCSFVLQYFVCMQPGRGTLTKPIILGPPISEHLLLHLKVPEPIHSRFPSTWQRGPMIAKPLMRCFVPFTWISHRHPKPFITAVSAWCRVKCLHLSQVYVAFSWSMLHCVMMDHRLFSYFWKQQRLQNWIWYVCLPFWSYHYHTDESVRFIWPDSLRIWYTGAKLLQNWQL